MISHILLVLLNIAFSTQGLNFFRKLRIASSPCLSLSASSSITGRSTEVAKKSVFIFGLGYVGTALAYHLKAAGWNVSGTVTGKSSRSIYKASELRKKGILALYFDPKSDSDWKDIKQQINKSTHLLSTIPPIDFESSSDDGNGNEIDGVLRVFRDTIQTASHLHWIGYLSSTGVYGECNGAWITENTPVKPITTKSIARVQAERSWLSLATSPSSLPVYIFRLAGVYGPGRSALETVKKAGGDLRLCAPDDRILTSRIHITDIVRLLGLSMNLSAAIHLTGSDIFNLADDQPCTRLDVLSFAARLLNYSLPVDSLEGDGAGLNFVPRVRGGSKRVDNLKIIRQLNEFGMQLQFPDYKSGLMALAKGDLGPFDQDFSLPAFQAVQMDTISIDCVPIPKDNSLLERTLAENQALKSQVTELEKKVINLENTQKAIKNMLVKKLVNKRKNETVEKRTLSDDS